MFSEPGHSATAGHLPGARALRKGADGLRPLENLNADAPGWLREKFCRADIAIFSRPVKVNLVAPLYPGFRAMQKHADEGS